MLKKLIAITIILFSFHVLVAQVNENKIQSLSEKFLNIQHKDSIEKESPVINKKNPAISLLLSLVLPGAGHLYAGRMDVGKYYLATEAAFWLGVIGLNQYGSGLKNDARSYATVHAGLSASVKDDNYFGDIGSWDNIYQFNNDKLAKGQWSLIYDVNKYYWSWDETNSRYVYESQRKKSERAYNMRIVFGTGLVINRIVSAISALVLTNGNKNNAGSLKISSEFISSPANPYDGLKLNFVKSF